MKIRTLKDIPEIKGKRILLRVDFNVPLKENGDVQDDTRIVESLDTINFLREKGAHIIIISHLGRPNGEYKDEFRLTKIAKYLETLVKVPVKKMNEVLGEKVENAIGEMQDGDIIMLENVRCEPGEEACDENFTKKLASLGEIYVSDAFGTVHRRHASTAGLGEYLPAYGGLLMEKEIAALSPLIEGEIEKPLTMIFGGAKIDTKIGIIKNFMEKANYFLMGGALANTFLAAKGYEVGKSLYEKDKIELAKEIMNQANREYERFIIPVDAVVAEEISETAKTSDIKVDHVAKESKILDIGSETIENFCKIIEKSGTVVWNGPLGLCEYAPFRNGTEAIAKCLAKSKAISIIGGGDTASALKHTGIPSESFTHISTGGGAAIEFLSGDSIPGIEILRK